MLISRERFTVLAILVFCTLSISTWIIWKGIDTHKNSFRAGLPPKDINQVITPTTVDVTKLKPPAIRPQDHVRYGSATSSISVIEYGDYACDDCKQVAKIIQNTLPAYNGKVRFIYHHLPIVDMHPIALDAAIFAECADRQGLFWETHDALMDADIINESTFSQIVKALKLDPNNMRACRAEPEISAAIQSNIEIARGDGVNGVPLIFIGTKGSYGIPSEEELKAEINSYIIP
ncbi:thioredoxin domain-containing protein [Candidatus Uhrbacteria bacterium]|nr:thioredoxin domain-containing protein [Candidatus Uhrbacteria bacterium]